MDNQEIIKILKETGILLELHGENPFKSRAYSNGAQILKKQSASIKKLSEKKELTEIKGVGKGLEHDILEILKMGDSSLHKELLSKTPKGLLEILKIPGLGPKKVNHLWKSFNLTSLGELEYACRENRLASLKGFGEKTQSHILESITFLNQNRSKYRLDEVLEIDEDFRSLLKNIPHHEGLLLTSGECRRLCNIVTEFHFIVNLNQLAQTSLSKEAFLKHVFSEVSQKQDSHPLETHLPKGASLFSGALKKSSASNETPFWIWFCPESYVGNLLFLTTASHSHIESLTHRPLKESYSLLLSQPFATEKELYAHFDLPWISPELREDALSLEWAKSGTLPTLISSSEIQGFYHVHTTYSDGANSLEEMVSHAENLGLTFIGISDHSKTASYAGGLKPEQIVTQHKEIDALNASGKYKVKILKGVESDILKDGSLDYPDEILKKMDFVIGSIHNSFNLSKKEQTLRLLNAMKNPYLTMIGHLTGRLLLGRNGYEIDHEAVIQEAVKRDIAIEINASPYRLDIDWKWARRLKELGGKSSINPDAHHYADYSSMVYGLAVARKAGFTAKELLNCAP